MPHPVQSGSDADDETTGRYSIGELRRVQTLLPPAGEETEVVSLEELGAVLEPDPAPAAPVEAAPPAVRGLISGVFSGNRSPAAPPPPPPPEDPELLALADSLQPYYREHERRKAERAELDIADLSLQPGNPYSASSLVPPPKRPFPWARTAAFVGLAAVACAGAGYALRAVIATDAPEIAKGTVPPAVRSIERPTPAVAPPAPEPTPAAEAEPSPAAETEPVSTAKAEPAPASAAEPRKPPATASRVPAPRAARPGAAPAAAAPAEAPGQAAETEPAPAPPAKEAASAPSAAESASQAAAAPADTPLPETPTREQVAAGFQAVRANLVQCAAGKRGIVQLSVTIANSGRIMHALVEGDFAGTPEGSCMARAVRAARFPQFSQPTLKVVYPLSL